MKQVINKISAEFIQESKASTRMVEDLAAMERYMAESYDGRTFIELIQNADDANANRIIVFDSGKDLIVANDGRPFDENDILSICRSGASVKQRGDKIGYRGIGFKSTTAISNEIIIYSADTFFTFSKDLCAEQLGLPKDKVPTVRIPFLYDKNILDDRTIYKIENIKSEGFTTFFIFRNANTNKFESELEGFTDDWLLFLKCIERIDINLFGITKSSLVKRKPVNSSEYIIETVNSKKQWYILTDTVVSFAFKYEKNSITACDAREGVFHCYLPTTDSTGFMFKINADFSTDPSRKHIIKDETTNRLIHRAESLFSDFVEKLYVSRRNNMMGIIDLIYTFSYLNDFSAEFRQSILNKMSDRSWIKTGNNNFIKPLDVKSFPDWMKDSERVELCEIPSVSAVTVSSDIIKYVPDILKILKAMGALAYSYSELLDLIRVYENCKLLKIDTFSKIFAYSVRECSFEHDEISSVYVPVNDDFLILKEISEDAELDQNFKRCVSSILSSQEIKSLVSAFPVFKSVGDSKKNKNSSKVRQLQPIHYDNTKNFSEKRKENLGSKSDSTARVNIDSRTKLAINKWKKPIQNCIASETLLGNSAKDVSKKESAYDVLSVTPDGGKRYIAVKQIPIMGDSFIISEAEYEAAQRLENEYLVFLITAETNDAEYAYLENPFNSLQMERKVKEWEWYCNNYAVEKESPSEQEESLIDERVLKCLSKDRFNSEQKNFLNDLLEVNTVNISGRILILVDQINSIADFYTGGNILIIKDDKVSIVKPLIATIKLIMK
ncbi:MAG: DUF3883 domain-containing protein [Lachnospiraceae bacterium]|nr:DUF3883 domain-containing protein [Lachnospiraceae bacterium]